MFNPISDRELLSYAERQAANCAAHDDLPFIVARDVKGWTRPQGNEKRGTGTKHEQRSRSAENWTSKLLDCGLKPKANSNVGHLPNEFQKWKVKVSKK